MIILTCILVMTSLASNMKSNPHYTEVMRLLDRWGKVSAPMMKNSFWYKYLTEKEVGRISYSYKEQMKELKALKESEIDPKEMEQLLKEMIAKYREYGVKSKELDELEEKEGLTFDDIFDKLEKSSPLRIMDREHVPCFQDAGMPAYYWIQKKHEIFAKQDLRILKQKLKGNLDKICAEVYKGARGEAISYEYKGKLSNKIKSNDRYLAFVESFDRWGKVAAPVLLKAVPNSNVMPGKLIFCLSEEEKQNVYQMWDESIEALRALQVIEIDSKEREHLLDEIADNYDNYHMSVKLGFINGCVDDWTPLTFDILGDRLEKNTTSENHSRLWRDNTKDI